MKIQTIFEAFEQFELGRDGMAELEGRLEAGLAKVDREGPTRRRPRWLGR